MLQSCQPIEKFLELNGLSKAAPGTLGKDDDREFDVLSLDQYYVPSSLVERWGSAMGILVLSNWL